LSPFPSSPGPGQFSIGSPATGSGGGFFPATFGINEVFPISTRFAFSFAVLGHIVHHRNSCLLQRSAVVGRRDWLSIVSILSKSFDLHVLDVHRPWNELIGVKAFSFNRPFTITGRWFRDILVSIAWFTKSFPDFSLDLPSPSVMDEMPHKMMGRKYFIKHARGLEVLVADQPSLLYPPLQRSWLHNHDPPILYFGPPPPLFPLEGPSPLVVFLQPLRSGHPLS